MRSLPWICVLPLLTGCASLQPVAQGELYRSGQLSPAQLEAAVRDHQIRTVVNLRGADPDRRWYQDQQQVCQRLGVQQVDIQIDSGAPDRREVEALLDVYRDAPKPILVTSRSRYGSAGLASGVYRTAILHQSPDVARRELAPWVSYRWPIPALSDHDRFLKNWTSTNDFYSGYQVADDRRLPDPQFNTASLPDPPSAPYRPAGDLGNLPAPAIDYFRPGDKQTTYATPSTPGEIRQVVWFGAPEEISDR